MFFPKKSAKFRPKKTRQNDFFRAAPPSNEWRSRFNIFPVRGKFLKMGVLEIALFRRKVVCERGRGRRFSGTCRTFPGGNFTEVSPRRIPVKLCKSCTEVSPGDFVISG